MIPGFPSCGYNLFQFGDQSSFSFANDTQAYTGRVEVCLDGFYVPVCSNAISSDDLDSICAEVQSSGKKDFNHSHTGICLNNIDRLYFIIMLENHFNNLNQFSFYGVYTCILHKSHSVWI